MNTAIPNVRHPPNVRDTPSTRWLAATMLLSLGALAACQLPPPAVMTPAVEGAAPASAMPAPQAPFDTTAFTPVESAGAAVG